ncbi:MAG: DNA polymerase III subunit gamma/tau, partial [Dehalococcoidia bacterium]
ILARAVNCANVKGGEPCNACPPCEAIARGNAFDLVELDAASNRGIDDIKELREKIAFAPSDLSKKVYLLDEVHMLTNPAFNALLKTLEEPPPHAIFILATTEAHQVPATIASRCQRYDFRRIPNDALVGLLRTVSAGEGYAIPDQALLQISIQSRGGARDAITLLEQVVARYGEQPSTDQVLEALGLVHDERSEKLVKAILDADLAAALDIAREVADDGVSIARFTKETLDILREILPQALRGTVDANAVHRPLADAAIASKRGAGPVVMAIQELAKADFRQDPASPIPLEVACASAVLGPLGPVAVAPAEGRGAAGAAPSRAAGARPPAGARVPDAALSREERFMADLYDSCKVANPRLGGWLNGSCKVLQLDDTTLELGFWNQMHLDKVDSDVRPLVEQQAEQMLNHPVALKLRLIEREQVPKRGPRGGHLAEAAKALGAVPVGKEG